MRRSDREVKEFKDIIAIMEKCDVCRIALNNNGYPYILPLNFGMDIKEDKIERGSCTMEYESVIGQGYIEILSDDEKYNALCILMQHYHQEDFPFNKLVMPHTKVFRLIVENVTGKVRMKKKDK